MIVYVEEIIICYCILFKLSDIDISITLKYPVSVELHIAY